MEIRYSLNLRCQKSFVIHKKITLGSLFSKPKSKKAPSSTHLTPSGGPTNPTEYRMTQLNGWHMTSNPDTFRQGASALRNTRDWTEEKRKELIAAANGKVPDAEHSDLVSSTQSFVSLSSNEATHPESETSADELALDVRVISYKMAQIDRECRRRLRRSLGYLPGPYACASES